MRELLGLLFQDTQVGNGNALPQFPSIRVPEPLAGVLAHPAKLPSEAQTSQWLQSSPYMMTKLNQARCHHDTELIRLREVGSCEPP